MNTKIGVLLLGFLALAPVSAPAQVPPPPSPDAPPGPPPGPLIARFAPNYAQWTVTTQDGVASAPGASDQAPSPSADAAHQPPLIVTVVKTGDTRHVTMRYGTGDPNADIWIKADNFLVMRPGWKVPGLSPAGSVLDGARVVDYSKSDFSGFEWLSAHVFAGTKSIGGRMCLLFKSTIVPVDGSTDQVSFAVVDLKTRLPVSLQVVKELTTYNFGAPPTEKLTLPPEFATVLTDYKRKSQNYGNPAALP